MSGTIETADSVEARWGDGGAWITLRTNTITKTFLDTLKDQSTGQHTLWVRNKNNISAYDSAGYVSVGDLFVVAGQSNASGRGTNNQTYSHPTLKASLFGNNYRWKGLKDPTDTITGQIDVVSNDGFETGGSLWPIIADSIMANYNIPVGFIPCAMGGTYLSSWLPEIDHLDRTTLYGSMHFRVDSCKGVKSILWWQGEANASGGSSKATYYTQLNTLANSAFSDFGVNLMPVKLQNCTDIEDAKEDTIRAAIVQAWTDNNNILEGPDFSDIETDDGMHIKTNAKIDSCANRFWRKIRDNIYAP